MDAKKRALMFSTNLSKLIFIIRRIERDTQRSSCKAHIYFCQILMKSEFSGQVFRRYPKLKFRENSFSGSRVVSCGRTDMSKQIIAFSTFAKASKKQLKKTN